MSKLIKIIYVGKKPFAYDNMAGSGKCWNGNGDVHEVTDNQAKQLLKYTDQWELVDAADQAAVDKPTTVEVVGEDGEDVTIRTDGLGKALEKMSKAELLAFGKAKFGKDMDMAKSKKALIDAIEEFERDLEPVGKVG